MRLVGFTGGIASGKSTVSGLFKSAGVPVVDADTVARNLVQKGTGGWKKIVKTFGNDILLENGEIDRALLGQIVLSDPEKRELLNRALLACVVSAVNLDSQRNIGMAVWRRLDIDCETREQ
ncbi:hypothetical protein ZWY2020_033558 [Hordeum vulgare]|nr:hypothetical protein ZWY2020_033558 [Hordeum vulgare]